MALIDVSVGSAALAGVCADTGTDVARLPRSASATVEGQP
jgi:hypothetical protein